MDALVLPLGTTPTLQGDLFAVLALLPDGAIGLGTGPSWADAAAHLAPQVSGAVRCEESLALVGRRFGWTPTMPTEEQRLQAAVIAVGLAWETRPHDENVAHLVRTWVQFFRLRLWEEVSADLAVPVLRHAGKKTSEQAITLLGQQGIEFGLVLYEDPRAFDAVWNAEPYPIDGVSVLTDQSGRLAPAFEALGVPPPVVTRLVKSRPKRGGPKDLVLATAAMQLLISAGQGEFIVHELGRGASLELGRAPEKKPRKRK